MNDYGLELTEGAQVKTATAVFTGVLYSPTAKDWGAGKKLVPLVRVGVATVNNATSCTFDIIAADNDALTTNPVTLSTSGAILVASLTKDSIQKLPPLKSGTSKCYLGAKITVTGGTAPDAGSTFTIWLAPSEGVPENVVNP